MAMHGEIFEAPNNPFLHLLGNFVEARIRLCHSALVLLVNHIDVSSRETYGKARVKVGQRVAATGGMARGFGLCLRRADE